LRVSSRDLAALLQHDVAARAREAPGGVRIAWTTSSGVEIVWTAQGPQPSTVRIELDPKGSRGPSCAGRVRTEPARGEPLRIVEVRLPLSDTSADVVTLLVEWRRRQASFRPMS
jgi:hypothetical protein